MNDVENALHFADRLSGGGDTGSITKSHLSLTVFWRYGKNLDAVSSSLRWKILLRILSEAAS